MFSPERRGPHGCIGGTVNDSVLARTKPTRFMPRVVLRAEALKPITSLLPCRRCDGARGAHLPAVRDDSARPGVRTDSVPGAGGQTAQESRFDVALQCPYLPWPVESQQQICEVR